MALSGRLNIKATNPDVVAEVISSLVSSCVARPAVTGSRIDYFGDFVGWSDFALGEARSASGLILKTMKFEERLLCSITTSGHLRYFCRGSTLNARSGDALICDSQIVEEAQFSEDFGQFFLTASMHSLERYAQRRFGSLKRTVAGTSVVLPQGHLGALALSGFAPLIHQLLIEKELLQNSPVKMRRCQDAFLEIVATCLAREGVFRHLRTEKTGSARHLRVAEEFMRLHAKEPIGVVEVADGIGISVRSLQLAYKQHTGQTPLARLQRIRLEGLQAELLGGASQNWRVTAAAWGFVAGPRVLKQYMAAFGETPEQTLARSRPYS